MAVDARRKWLPREKVMPGKPGGDAHTADQSESSPSPVQWSGTTLPPMGVLWAKPDWTLFTLRAPGSPSVPSRGSRVTARVNGTNDKQPPSPPGANVAHIEW
ncbi:hypothetical protein JOQ06_025522, partial [Pogonophryne albipinna]